MISHYIVLLTAYSLTANCNNFLNIINGNSNKLSIIVYTSLYILCLYMLMYAYCYLFNIIRIAHFTIGTITTTISISFIINLTL